MATTKTTKLKTTKVLPFEIFYADGIALNYNGDLKHFSALIIEL